MTFVVVLLGVLALSAAYSRFVIWRLETIHPPIGDFITVDGVRLHYVDVGTGPAVVLLHGVSASLRDFEASILHALAKTHRVIAFDRPGYGFTRRPSGDWTDPTQQADLICKALQALNVGRPVLVGHSWSGSVVLAALLNHPRAFAGGVSLAGALNPWRGGVTWFYELATRPFLGSIFTATLVAPLGQLLMNSVLTKVFSPEHPPLDYRRRTAVDLALRPATFRASADDICGLNDHLSHLSRRYDDIAAPLLLVTGDGDKIVPACNHAHLLAGRLPHANLVTMENTGHALHHSRADEVTALIADFVAANTADKRESLSY